MNRLDRLFAITLMLQAKGRLRAKDLTAWLEISERTIYRDIATLSESGVHGRGDARRGQVQGPVPTTL